MRKYLWLLIIIPTLCYGASGDVASIGGKAVTAVSSVMGKAGTAILTMAGKPYSDGDSECTGYIVCQNNETATTGWDNSESWTTGGNYAIDPDRTSGALRGSQSLQLGLEDTAGTDTVTKTITAAGELYGHFMFRMLGTAKIEGGTAYMLSLKDASNNQMYGLDPETYSTVYEAIGASIGGGDFNDAGTTILVNTTYHCWFYWKKGTGTAEGKLKITTGTTRGTWGVEKTGTAANDVTQIVFTNVGNPNAAYLIDQILLSATEFTTVP